MATGSISPARFLLALLVLLVFATSVNAAEPPEIRAGSELDFRPYCFTDKNGQPTGFGVELLQAAAEKATLPLRISPGEWDKVWNELVNGRIDVLPVVARTSSREGLVEFTLPHTETFDAFFVRTGRPPIKDLAAAAGKEIVVLRSDAAHHQLIERKFPGQIVPVDSIAEGLRLIASGKHDALLCSRLIGVLERDQAGIKSVTDGPVIPDYKRAFSFAVRKGNTELVERLNQGLRLVQADGTYDRLYRKWLGVQIRPLPTWQTYFWQALGILGVLVLIAITWLVARKALEWERRQSRVLTPKPPGVRSAFWPYALAVVAVATGYAVRVGLEEWVGRGLPAFSMFYPPVIVAALLGGLGPGLLATAAGAAIAVVLIMPSIGDLRVALPVERLSLVLYLITGLFMTAVAELHRRNRAKAAAFDREEALRETRREKEFLANLLETAEQPFAIGYPDGRIGLVNRAYEQLTGYTAAELRALDWSVLAPPEWRDHERQKLAELHRTGQPVRYEKEHLHKDGTRVPVELFVNLGRDDAGQPEFYYAFITDITVRKRAEEALQQLNEILEKRVAERTAELAQTVEVLKEEIEQRMRVENELKLANERLAQRADQLRRLAGELTAVEQAERKRLSRILHDGLQQHLASAKLQLGGLAKQIENEDLKRTADEIEKVIGEGLSMSRSLNAELSPPILHEGRLPEGLEWLIRWMREKHRLSVELSLGAVPELREDLKMLVFESVRELLFNALKHAQVSRAQVRLELVGDGEMRVTVSDEGAGFDPCRLLPAGDGGGFGLFSIRERIGIFGGRLEIDSAPGKGSRVALTVPLGKADAAPFLVDAVFTPAVLPPRIDTENHETTIRVLLVDDHALFRNGMARLLKNEPGLEIVGEAKDGQEAIKFTQELKPDVILMDVSMPGLNGIEATRIIHEQHPKVCIIGLSMYDDPEKARAMRAVGATDYRTKGCTAAELVATIRAGLQTRKPAPE